LAGWVSAPSLNVVVRIELTILSEIPGRVQNVFALHLRAQDLHLQASTFPVAIRSDLFATDCIRLKKFGREV